MVDWLPRSLRSVAGAADGAKEKTGHSGRDDRVLADPWETEVGYVFRNGARIWSWCRNGTLGLKVRAAFARRLAGMGLACGLQMREKYEHCRLLSAMGANRLF